MFHSWSSRMVLWPQKGTVGRLSTTVTWSCCFGTDQPMHKDAVTKNPPLGAIPGKKMWGNRPTPHAAAGKKTQTSTSYHPGHHENPILWYMCSEGIFIISITREDAPPIWLMWWAATYQKHSMGIRGSPIAIATANNQQHQQSCLFTY